MGDITLAWLLGVFGIIAGGLWWRNAFRRHHSDLDYRKRFLRLAMGLCLLYIGAVYIAVGMGLVEGFSYLSLILRPAIVVLFATCIGYGIIEY